MATNTISKQAEKDFADRIEAVFETQLDNKALSNHEPEMYEEMVQTAFKQMGYPDNANSSTLDHDFSLKSAVEYEDWADRIISFHEFSTDEDLKKPTDEIIREFILRRLDLTHIQITAKEEVSEFKEKHPTTAYLAEMIDKYFDYDEYVEAIEQQAPEAVREAVTSRADEEGIQYNDLSDIDYRIVHARQKVTMSEYADTIQSKIPSVYSTATDFAKNHLYDDLIAQNNYEFAVEITGGEEGGKTPEQLEQYPTVDYMQKRAEERYDEDKLKEIIKESRYGVLDRLVEACDEEGIPRDYAQKVNYRILNVQLMLPLNDMAEIWTEEAIEQGMTATAYLDEYMYEFILANTEYDVEITDDPEDYR